MFKNMRIWWFEWKCWYYAPGDDSKRVRNVLSWTPKCSKVRISTEAPRRFDVQKHENLMIWWKCWYCAPGDDSKRFRKCVQLAPKWSKKSGLDGILVQMGPKIPQNELSKTHTSPLSKSFRHKITILSSSVFALTDFFYFEKMQVISCDL